MDANRWLEENMPKIKKIMLKLFDNPEIAGEEYFAMKCMSDFLIGQGFTVKCGIGNLETSFVATWGEEGPVVGFLAEYDALPKLGQQAVPYRTKIEGHGHGCGHNLLGAGIIAAGCALKSELEEFKIPGRVVIYGCPEEVHWK